MIRKPWTTVSFFFYLYTWIPLIRQKEATSYVASHVTSSHHRTSFTCHLCPKSYSRILHLKPHYIMAHFRARFQARYAPRRVVSTRRPSGERLACVGRRCRYSGSARGLLLHMGIGHAQLQHYLPREVWSGLVGAKVGSAAIGQQPPSDAASAQRKAESDLTASGYEKNGVPESRHDEVAITEPASSEPEPNDAVAVPERRLTCHLCDSSYRWQTGLKRHYIQAGVFILLLKITFYAPLENHISKIPPHPPSEGNFLSFEGFFLRQISCC